MFDEVLSAARVGDVSALGEMYRFYQPSLVRYLRANAPDAADDLASETWLDVAGGLDRFRGDEPDFRRWIFTIARRRLLDDRRRVIRRRTDPTDAARLDRNDPAADTQAEALGRIDSATAIRRIMELPPEQAEVVLLRVVAGLSAEDVASMMNKTAGNIRVIQHRALTQLARQAERVERGPRREWHARVAATFAEEPSAERDAALSLAPTGAEPRVSLERFDVVVAAYHDQGLIPAK